MRNDPEEKQLQEEFPEILGELAALRQAIDSRTYPGRAWPVHRPIFRRLSWPGVAVAAAVLVLVGLVWLVFSDRDIAGPEGSSQAISEATSADWIVSTNIDLSLVSSVKLEIPSVSLPSVDDFGELEFSIPTITFPTLTEDRRNNHEL